MVVFVSFLFGNGLWDVCGAVVASHTCTFGLKGGKDFRGCDTGTGS